jgi:indolepyruvate ferredoxin oxidoreductase alpha subunit
MTGHQPHPGTGKTGKGEKTHAIDYAILAKSIGVKYVKKVDPYNLQEIEAILREAVSTNEPAVVISEHPCVLLPEEKAKIKIPYYIEEELCTGCNVCLWTGCPALIRTDGIPELIPEFCIGCSLCAQLCKFDAMFPVERDNPVN